ncbi:hypothetical protein H5410_045473 [Solanum commersonii]|uniref:Uncharacterized protein n=1 Tax=Solanum commersonii TaxID=4109 RepID=A0A9J5XBQ3_SOLCO|nr:hypothetical protein H5410_045473 [Solanum commersonii]
MDGIKQDPWFLPFLFRNMKGAHRARETFCVGSFRFMENTNCFHS